MICNSLGVVLNEQRCCFTPTHPHTERKKIFIRTKQRKKRKKTKKFPPQQVFLSFFHSFFVEVDIFSLAYLFTLLRGGTSIPYTCLSLNILVTLLYISLSLSP